MTASYSELWNLDLPQLVLLWTVEMPIILVDAVM